MSCPTLYTFFSLISTVDFSARIITSFSCAASSTRLKEPRFVFLLNYVEIYDLKEINSILLYVPGTFNIEFSFGLVIPPAIIFGFLLIKVTVAYSVVAL
jgi:hypothetical protein